MAATVTTTAASANRQHISQKRLRAQTLVLTVPSRPPLSAPSTPHPSYHSHSYPQPQPLLAQHSQPHAGPSSAAGVPTAAAAVAFATPQSAHVSEILPRLYISDLQTAEDAAALSALGITHVLSAMPGHVALPPVLVGHAEQVPLHDTPFAELAAHLPRTTHYISRALRSSSDARILVHCAMGASRSVAVVCGYLIAAHGFHPAQALELVRSRRAAAAPNRGFIEQLYEYHRSLPSGGPTVLD
jgi:atypical dual specificity phosphatase